MYTYRIHGLSLTLCLIIGVIFMSACTPNEPEIEYNIGYLNLDANESISLLFDLVGEAESVAYVYESGNSKIVYGQQTSDGGWVAWSENSNMYAYTESDVGMMQIRFYLANQLGELLIAGK